MHRLRQGLRSVGRQAWSWRRGRELVRRMVGTTGSLALPGGDPAGSSRGP